MRVAQHACAVALRLQPLLRGAPAQAPAERLAAALAPAPHCGASRAASAGAAPPPGGDGKGEDELAAEKDGTVTRKYPASMVEMFSAIARLRGPRTAPAGAEEVQGPSCEDMGKLEEKPSDFARGMPKEELAKK